MKECRKVRAVIFDLDGTLLDTLADIGTVANQALCRFGLPARSYETYRKNIGHGIRNLFRTLIPDSVPEHIYQCALQDYLENYPKKCTIHTDYFPGIQSFLKFLKSRDIRIAVLSNKTEQTCQKIVNYYFPDDPWEFIWGRVDDRPLKPDPEAGRLACQILSLQPNEIMFVGDGETDMEFAAVMGFYSVGAVWGYRESEELRISGADILVNSFSDLQTKMMCAMD